MKLNILNKKWFLGISAVMLFSLSSCEQPYNIRVNTAGAGGSNPLPAPSLPPVIVPSGLLNGHFDVDTATSGMPYHGGNGAGNGVVTAHVHEYDKVNSTTTVDFFNLSNAGLDQEAGTALDRVQDAIHSSERFYLIVVNSKLNPGTVLEINRENLEYATTYESDQQRVLSSGGKPQVYTLGKPTVKGDKQLTDLVVAFDPTVDASSLLIPTSPVNCVFPNIPGALGEYRDGALVIQAVSVSNFVQDKYTGAAVAPVGGLIWEGIVYNHFMLKGPLGIEVDPEYCYGQIVNGKVFY